MSDNSPIRPKTLTFEDFEGSVLDKEKVNMSRTFDSMIQFIEFVMESIVEHGYIIIASDPSGLILKNPSSQDLIGVYVPSDPKTDRELKLKTYVKAINLNFSLTMTETFMESYERVNSELKKKGYKK